MASLTPSFLLKRRDTPPIVLGTSDATISIDASSSDASQVFMPTQANHTARIAGLVGGSLGSALLIFIAIFLIFRNRRRARYMEDPSGYHMWSTSLTPSYEDTSATSYMQTRTCNPPTPVYTSTNFTIRGMTSTTTGGGGGGRRRSLSPIGDSSAPPPPHASWHHISPPSQYSLPGQIRSCTSHLLNDPFHADDASSIFSKEQYEEEEEECEEKERESGSSSDNHSLTCRERNGDHHRRPSYPQSPLRLTASDPDRFRALPSPPPPPHHHSSTLSSITRPKSTYRSPSTLRRDNGNTGNCSHGSSRKSPMVQHFKSHSSMSTLGFSAPVFSNSNSSP